MEIHYINLYTFLQHIEYPAIVLLYHPERLIPLGESHSYHPERLVSVGESYWYHPERLVLARTRFCPQNFNSLISKLMAIHPISIGEREGDLAFGVIQSLLKAALSASQNKLCQAWYTTRYLYIRVVYNTVMYQNLRIKVVKSLQVFIRKKGRKLRISKRNLKSISMDWGHLPRLMYLVHGYAPLGIHVYSVETISALWVYMGFISILDFFFYRPSGGGRLYDVQVLSVG